MKKEKDIWDYEDEKDSLSVLGIAFRFIVAILVFSGLFCLTITLWYINHNNSFFAEGDSLLAILYYSLPIPLFGMFLYYLLDLVNRKILLGIQYIIITVGLNLFCFGIFYFGITTLIERIDLQSYLSVIF